MLTENEMADLMLEQDRSKSYAVVDAMSEADAKQMLKRMLSALQRFHWEGSDSFSKK